MVEEYFDGASAIYIHNHLCQGGLAHEEVQRMHNWCHQMADLILGIIETNAYLAFNNFGNDKGEVEHTHFTSLPAGSATDQKPLDRGHQHGK